MSTEYELKTLGDVVRLYAALPDERGDLLLKELTDAIVQSALLSRMLDVPQDLQRIVWIDDDGGETPISYNTPDGKTVMQYRASRAPSQPDGGKQ